MLELSTYLGQSFFMKLENIYQVVFSKDRYFIEGIVLLHEEINKIHHINWIDHG